MFWLLETLVVKVENFETYIYCAMASSQENSDNYEGEEGSESEFHAEANSEPESEIEPYVSDCVQYFVALLHLQRAKELEHPLVDLIGIYLGLYRRDCFDFVKVEDEVIQLQSAEGHSGMSFNWTVELGFQLPFARAGSRLLFSGEELQEDFGPVEKGAHYACRHPIFPDVLEKLMIEVPDSDLEPSESSGSRDSEAVYPNLPGGGLRRLLRDRQSQVEASAHDVLSVVQERARGDMTVEEISELSQEILRELDEHGWVRRVSRRLFE